jgi:autotransporter passenger strand-loop-strand repeat protein
VGADHASRFDSGGFQEDRGASIAISTTINGGLQIVGGPGSAAAVNTTINNCGTQVVYEPLATARNTTINSGGDRNLSARQSKHPVSRLVFGVEV